MSGPENFIPVQNGEHQLYLPAHVADAAKRDFMAPAELTVNGQEMKAQQLVMGFDGHGPLRNQDKADLMQERAAEDLDKSIRDMLDPRNVIELKAAYEHKVGKKLGEKSLGLIDARNDRDGSIAAKNKEEASALKQDMISAYTQVGVKEGEKRDVSESVVKQISEMMKLSNKELEARIAKQEAAKAEKAANQTPAAVVDGAANEVANDQDPEFIDDGQSEGVLVFDLEDEPVLIEEENEDPEADQYIPNTDDSEEESEEQDEDSEGQEENLHTLELEIDSRTDEKREKDLKKEQRRIKRDRVKSALYGAHARLTTGGTERDANGERKSRRKGVAAALGAFGLAAYLAKGYTTKDWSIKGGWSEFIGSKKTSSNSNVVTTGKNPNSVDFSKYNSSTLVNGLPGSKEQLAKAVSAVADKSTAIDVVKGVGINEQLAKGLHLSPSAAEKAAKLLDQNGFFNGDKILGIGHVDGKVVPYEMGAGDRKFYLPKEAIDLLKANKIL